MIKQGFYSWDFHVTRYLARFSQHSDLYSAFLEIIGFEVHVQPRFMLITGFIFNLGVTKIGLSTRPSGL